MSERTVNINNFIGVYDGYITPEECNNTIKFYEDQDKFKNTMNRIEFENSPITEKQDQQYFAGPTNLKVWWENIKPLLHNFDMAWQHYKKNTGAGAGYNQEKFFYTEVKIQKTLPTEGYHVWHLEHGSGFDNESRAFVYTIYLNDVEEGGETEFLHFSKRVKPKTGRIVIWPAAFPYVHRGNSPLSGEKYILTSWLLLR
tara:strand:- start:846 stop:1442 length:597 start_codon:yes stop_codon:yes gene_type:complete